MSEAIHECNRHRNSQCKVAVWVVSLVLSMGCLTDHAAAKASVEEVARLLVTLCVGGGSITITKSAHSGGSFAVGSEKGSTTIEKTEATGLVAGINNALGALAANQADEARKCMRPYIARLMTLSLGDEEIVVVDHITEVSSNVLWRNGSSSENFDRYANYSFIYKNSSPLDATCRLIITSVEKIEDSDDIRRRFDQDIHDRTIASGTSAEFSGRVGAMISDRPNRVRSIKKKMDCW